MSTLQKLEVAFGVELSLDIGETSADLFTDDGGVEINRVATMPAWQLRELAAMCIRAADRLEDRSGAAGRLIERYLREIAPSLSAQVRNVTAKLDGDHWNLCIDLNDGRQSHLTMPAWATFRACAAAVVRVI